MQDPNDNEGVEVEEETEEETTEETTDDPAALKARIQRLEEKAIAQRERTRMLRQELQKAKPKADAPKTEEKQTGLDRLDRAVLRMEKITADNEIALVEDIMKTSGKTVEQVLESKYFKSELAAMREEQAAKEAAPSGTKRSGQTAKDDVDYWLAKGPGPDGLPKDNPELARKVVEARLAKHKKTNMFSDNPIM